MATARRHSATQGVVWAAVDRVGTVALQFVINLALAHMLTPSDFGCVGMILIFVAVAQIVIDGGFGAALIQRPDPSERDYATIFYWNILFSLIIYALIYALAPAIGHFFRIEALGTMLRVLGMVVIIGSLALVQRTILRKRIDFRSIAITDIVSYTLGAIVAIAMARRGFGAWSIVAMQLTNTLISTSLLWLFSHWRPTLTFSLSSLRELFAYGGYLLLANTMQEVCTHIQGVVIGRRFSATETGLYTQAKKMEEVASMTLPSILCQVMFPLLAARQSDIDSLRTLLRRTTRIAATLIFPLMVVLALVAEPLFMLLYGTQWSAAVPYFRVLCVGGLFSALYNFNYYAIAAIGRSRTLLLWGCYKWGALVVLLLAGAAVGMTGVLVAMVVSNINIYLTNALLAQRYLGYRLTEQLRDVAPALVASLLAGAVIVALWLWLSVAWWLAAACYLGLYLAISYAANRKSINDIVQSIGSQLNWCKYDRERTKRCASGEV